MTPITLIAEVASNAGNSLPLAKRFIQDFAAAGADIVKFQLTRVRHLRLTDPQYAWFASAEWTAANVLAIKAECALRNVGCMFTVYNFNDIPEYVSYGIPLLKIGSGEAHREDLAIAIMQNRSAWTDIYVSTGLRAAHRDYVESPLDHIHLLYAVTRYPAPPQMFPRTYQGTSKQGWSDHCVGLDACYSAIIRGASCIEKHVQIVGQARPPSPWEATATDFALLRAYADDNPETRFIDRWTVNP